MFSGRCHVPDFLRERKAWGISLQLYELRSARNWGIGDFSDLAEFCEVAADAGADFIGLNPLHALFTAGPARCSPFSPSNRLFLNPLYIAVREIDSGGPEITDSATMDRLLMSDFVDYPVIARLKFAALRYIYARRSRPPEFEAFVKREGLALRMHAVFEALSHEMVKQGDGAGWTTWPEPLRRADSEHVTEFAREHADDVEFHLWLQWQAHCQLKAAASRARAAGMRIGLYLDLAVGEAPDGSATWSAPGDFVAETTIGAPPDVFSTSGQNWGLAALSPRRLEESNAARIGELASALMQYAGAVRVDHAMALEHLFLVQEGRSPEDGAYVEYPTDLIIEALARVSNEWRSIVIGEDLGVVPSGFRDLMEGANLFSYRPLYFERDDAAFKAADTYPELSLSCLSTHDLPTLVGWWRGHDLVLREEHGLVDSQLTLGQRETREAERQMLLRLFGLQRSSVSMHKLAVAAHKFLASTTSMLCAVRLADLVGEAEPTNLPGTSDSYPNWSRRLRVSVEECGRTELWRDVVRMMKR